MFDLNIDFQGNGLDLSLLENIKYRSNKIIARCPACAEEGHDHTGDHLFIDRSGKFGCVVFPGDEGMNHRKIIYKLVGVKKRRFDKKFKVNKLIVETSGQSDQGVQRNILGRLGRFDMTHAYDALILEKSNITSKCDLLVPSVPEQNIHLYTKRELELLSGFDSESIKKIDLIKKTFNGTICM